MAWGIPAWTIVVIAWVMAITRQADLLVIGLVIGVLALLVAMGAIWAWVAHNRALAHRRERARGGRRGAPDVPVVVERDARGRPVEIAPGCERARLLVARIEGDRKVIAPGDAP